MSDVLLKVTLDQIPNSVCQALLRSYNIHNSMVCTYTDAKDTCQVCIIYEILKDFVEM